MLSQRSRVVGLGALVAALSVTAGALLRAAAAGATPTEQPYSAEQVQRAFAAQGIDLCRIGPCGQMSGRSRSWIATIAEGRRRYLVLLDLHRNATQSAQVFKLAVYGNQLQGSAQARIGNLYVQVSRAEDAPRSQRRTTREFPAAVRRALARLAGMPLSQTAARQHRICRTLAAHPLGAAPPARGGPCPTLPATRDNDEQFVAQLGAVRGAKAYVRYRIYGSVAQARRSWPRDADEQPTYAIGGAVPGLKVPSLRWRPLPPDPNRAGATVLVGQVLAMVELIAPKQERGDVAAASALARGIVAYLTTVTRQVR